MTEPPNRAGMFPQERIAYEPQWLAEQEAGIAA